MRTKKINFNGNAEVLVNFLTQHFPERYLAGFKVLLDLKYPISDKQVFFDQIEKIKEDDFVKDLLLTSFTPVDFSLDSPINALEKFQFNIKRKNALMPSYGAYDYPYEFSYGKMPVKDYLKFSPYQEFRAITPFQSKFDQMERFYSPNSPTYFWPEWNMERDFNQSYMNKNLKFGKDIFGDVAASLYGELISKGMKEDYAYNIAREKEIACRNFVPTFETEFNERAKFIFASHFILLGKDVKESFWAAKFFLTKPFSSYVKTDPTAQYFEKFPPKMKKEFVEPVM
jgi:hypothetical protein